MHNTSKKKAETIQIDLSEILANLPDNTLPDPDTVSYYVLEKKRIVYLETFVDFNMLALHRLIVRWNIEDEDVPVEQRIPIKIYIMSNGGDLDFMWSTIDIISMSKTPVITVNIGLAASAAALIFLSGHRRFMTKNSRLIIHEGSADISGDAVKVIDTTKAYQQDLKRMKDFIESKTNIPHKEIMKRRSNDWYLDSEFCLKNGACEAVISSLEEICL